MPSGKIPALTMKPNSCASIAYEKCPSKPRTINHGKLRDYQLTSNYQKYQCHASGRIPTLTMKPTWSCASIANEKCPSKPSMINHGKLRNY